MVGASQKVLSELDSRPDSWQLIVSAARQHTVTLVYSSHHEERNNAVALHECLRANIRAAAALARPGRNSRLKSSR
jgi:hypothetical protein